MKLHTPTVVKIRVSRLSIFFILAVFIGSMVVFPGTAVQAANTPNKEDLEALYGDWPNWVGAAPCLSASEIGSNTAGNITLIGNDNAAKAYNFLLSKGLPPNQVAAFIGNFMWESNMNPTRNQDRGGAGRGIAQWEVGGRWDTGKQSLKAFANGEDVNTLEVQLQFVWYELTKTSYSKTLTELDKSSSVDDMTDIVMRLYERPSEPHLAERQALARQAISTLGNSQTATSSPGAIATASGCYGSGSEAGAVAGDIVQTALNLAWKTQGHGPEESDAKPNYRTAMQQYNGSTGSLPFSDCGVFVATVMVATGADSSYPKRGTSVQLDYLQAHKDKYQSLGDATSTAGLQPGDILIRDGHTFIYVGKQDNGYNVARASLTKHVPERANFYTDGGAPWQAFRLIKGDTTT